jgi:hypothetical protein
MFVFTLAVHTSDIVPAHSKDMSLILKGVKIVCYEVKVKIYLLQAMEAHRVARG